MTDLKPCPRCGSNGVGINRYIFVNDETEDWDVWCDECDLHTAYYKTEEQAVEAWNRMAEEGERNDK